MSQKLTAVIIEDEKNICRFIESVLAAEAYKTVTAANGTEGLSVIASLCPDIILLDLGLPDMDGMEIIKNVRQFTSTPIIVISARSREDEKVAALDCGADDYITKPFGTSELMARIRTALRHSHRTASADTVYACGGLVIDFERRIISLDGENVHLTQIEYKLVSMLARQAGKVLTYDYLMRQIWGPYSDNNNQILRVNMAHIRRKLEKNPAEPEYIFTEIGVGYRMREE